MPQTLVSASAMASPDQAIIPLESILALHRALISARARLPDLDPFLVEVIEILRASLQADGCLVALCAPDGHSLAQIVAGGLVPDLPPGGRLPVVPPCLAYEAGADPHLIAHTWAVEAARGSGLEVLAAAALVVHDDWIGIACLFGQKDAPRPAWRQEGFAAAALEIGLAVTHLRLRRDVEERLRERNERWSALHDIGVILTRNLDNMDLLDEIVRRAISLLRTRGGGLSLLDEVTGESAVLVAYDRGESMPQMLGRRIPPGAGLLGRILLTGEPQFEPAYLFPPADADSPPLRLSVLGAPLFVGGSCVGMLAVGDDPEHRRFSTDQTQTLVLLAQQAGALLERIRGHAQRELLTVHRERSRLARELHDGLAQNLASLLLKAELCHDMAHRGEPELEQHLDQLADGIQQAVRETRSAISSLHETPLDDRQLMDALSLLAARFESQTGVRVALSWDGQAHRMFPQAAHTALLRVAQEALANVRKHANANVVCVNLNATDLKTVELSVHDDGCGFRIEDLDAPENGHRFGLRGMRSRMEELGGSLRVEAAPGCGVTVVATLPLV